MGNNILYNLHDEGWKQSQTNMWNLYWENGLMVGQFGVVGYDYLGQEAPAMMAGNTFTAAFVLDTATGYGYVFHNDESFHSGLGCWQITGLNTIAVQSAPFVNPTTVVPLPGTDLMAGLPKNTVLADGTTGWNRYPTTEDYTNLNTQYWTVKTGVRTYGYFNPTDLYIYFRSGSGTNYVTRDLGNITTDYAWIVDATFSWDQNYENENNGASGSTIDVLDPAGKIISRVYTRALNPTRYLYGNTALITSDITSNFQRVTNKFQNLTITATSTGSVFQYANYTPVSSPMFDATADWSHPRAIKWSGFMNTGGTNYRRVISINKLRIRTVLLSDL